MSGDYKIRGVQKRQERDASEIYRDSRRTGEKIADWFGKPTNLAFCMLISALMIVYVPAAVELIGFIVLIFWLIFSGKSRRLHLPMRMPFEHAGVDYNDPLPGRSIFGTKFRKSRGIFFLGNEKETNQELHLSADDMLTHMLLFGTTGAGKTEALLSLAWNSIAMGSGLIFIDPKGTNKLGLQVYAMARVCGREDDFLEINFSTGNREVNAFSNKRLSNTANPFAYGTADSLAEILVSLIPTSEGENAVFSERAVSLIYTVMRPLVDLRDKKVLQLSISTIRDHLNLEKCMELATDPRISDASRKSMEAYLNSVAGFKAGQPYEKQGEDAHKQFGFAQAYFTRALSSLVDTYGHVYGAMMGEVDYPDVVFNRRILVILLPAMEKPPNEIKTLGKIILSAIRGAMSLGLGSEYEGTKEEMLDSLPTASNVPNLVIADEYGYVATEGFAVTAAQARGLGFSCVFAGQDYAGFKRGSETEAEQILANTKVKLIMALEDAQATLEVVRAIGGEAYVTNTSGYTMDGDGLSSSYRDIMNVSVEKRQRVDIMDLRGQIEGEFHAFHKDNIVRGQMFHADPQLKDTTMRFNRFLEVLRPERSELMNRYGPVKDLTSELKSLIRGGTIVKSTRPATEMPALRVCTLLNAIRRKAATIPANDSVLVALLTSMAGYQLPEEVEERQSEDQTADSGAADSKAAGSDETQTAIDPAAVWQTAIKSSSGESSVTSSGNAEDSLSSPSMKPVDVPVGDVTPTASHLHVTLTETDTSEQPPSSSSPQPKPAETTPTRLNPEVEALKSAFGGMNMPDFAAQALHNAQTDDSDEDQDDEDEAPDASAELRALLNENMKSSIISPQVAERIKECSETISPEEDPEEAVADVKAAVGSTVSEYPEAPLPDPAPNKPFEITNRLRKLKSQKTLK